MKKILFIILLFFSLTYSYAQVKAFDSGYKGFTDIGYTIGIGDYEFGRFEINTTHGYQVNPFFFVGGGVGFHFMSEYKTKSAEIALDKRDSKVSIPLFADFRGTFSKKKISPFVDLRLGYFVTNNDKFYSNASIGCRVAVKGKQNISISIGYTYQKLEFMTFDRFIGSSNMDYTRTPRILDCGGISIKLGYDF